jgi:phosphohistidine phosphatase
LRHEGEDIAGIAARKIGLEHRSRGFSPTAGRSRPSGQPEDGAWIKHHKLVPDVVLSSMAERARATTVAACKAMGLPLKTVRWDERIYAAPVAGSAGGAGRLSEERAARDGRRTQSGARRSDGVSEPRQLEIPDDGKVLPTSALAQLEMVEDWSNLGAAVPRLISVTRPGQVPELPADRSRR